MIADLEDVVAPAGKPTARESVALWLRGLAEPVFESWVRVNPTTDLLHKDIAAVFGPELQGIMVPKVRSVDELLVVGDLLGRQESAAGLPLGTVKLLLIVETAPGLLAASDLARAPRVHQLMIGEFDLAAEVGVDPTYDIAFLPLRMQLVVASAAAGIEPPLGPVSPNYRDLASLRDETKKLVRLRFGSRPAIHPAQVPVFNEALTPASEGVERARHLIDLFERVVSEGRGVANDDDGHMVDEAVVKVARRVLERARRAGTQP